MAIFLGILGVLAFIVLAIIGLYNRLMKQNVLVDEAWSGIDVQLKKRFDLIPNLVETVKGYAKQEKDVFERVTQLRSSMMSTQDPKELGRMEGEFRQTLKTLFAVSEAYPELKSNENFLSLQSSLQEIETELEGARRYYNGTVRDLNQMIVVFPTNFLAGFFNIKKREFFEIADAAERQNVKVSFSDAAPTVTTTK
jgi:LemA protein